MKFLISLLTLLITINSCDSSKKVIENSKKMEETLSGTYFMTQLGDTEVSSNKIAITFDGTSNKVTGFAGCNNFFGNYTTQNNTIRFSDISTSKKLCQQDIMNIENYFLKSLNSINSFSKTDTNISFSENDNLLMEGTSKVVASEKSTIESYNYKTAVKYQALSRGSFDFILISKSRILISKDQGLQNTDTYDIESKDWEAINELIEAIEVETIHNLKPPTEKHLHDGAPHATLAIIIGDVEYMTPTFDHGNPPQEIEALVNKVLSIKENTVKQ